MHQMFCKSCFDGNTKVTFQTKKPKKLGALCVPTFPPKCDLGKRWKDLQVFVDKQKKNVNAHHESVSGVSMRVKLKYFRTKSTIASLIICSRNRTS